MERLGDSEFCIEFMNYSDKNLLNLRLIINGNIMGTLDSPTYLPSFISELKYILLGKEFFNIFVNDANFYNFFINGNNVSSSYKITLEETFDDFIKRCVRNEEYIYFFWFLAEEHFFKYQVNEGEFFFGKVAINKFRSVIEKFENYLSLDSSHF